MLCCKLEIDVYLQFIIESIVTWNVSVVAYNLVKSHNVVESTQFLILFIDIDLNVTDITIAVKLYPVTMLLNSLSLISRVFVL